MTQINSFEKTPLREIVNASATVHSEALRELIVSYASVLKRQDWTREPLHAGSLRAMTD
jgi:hypothetical protein